MIDSLAELFVKLEGLQREARAFVVVTVDDDTGHVVYATGPFTEPEAALVQAGRDDADWKAHADPGEGDFQYLVVPLWEPTQ